MFCFHVNVESRGLWRSTFFRFMKDKYTPTILSTPGKITVLLGTVALLAAGIYGATQVKHHLYIISTMMVFLVPERPEHYVPHTAVDYSTLQSDCSSSLDKAMFGLFWLDNHSHWSKY